MGGRAIHYAAVRGQVDVLKILAQAGADLNAQNYSYYSALHVAIKEENIETVKCLLVLKANPSLQVGYLDYITHYFDRF